ncbi:uncharacterized protein [Typha latifolia]|uniref:uncharacterized protein n=1 Tax=Typha latifolia TaxID=4733 RepID=UPI003C2B1169
MKLVWKKKNSAKGEVGKKRNRQESISPNTNLPFDRGEEEDEVGVLDEFNRKGTEMAGEIDPRDRDLKQLFESFRTQGNQLAEEGRYREALGKWEAALNLMPDSAKLHEQKAQVFLELGDAWKALKSATRATQLEPSWPEAWLTLGRAQLNFGEPDSSIESFDKALAMTPDYEEARVDRETAVHLVKKRKQLHSSDLNADNMRFRVGDKVELSEA